ncbi:uncharacterized protein LOC106088446 [Stomoxys calcitrans]|uniref:uncharacterized protein LOC106088446 n=1 Tax=Stomoxys calcitrans TaxID=35570 RepID=UPI0027E2567F|nr:uncharacterized protein LOC106088446 [Stomoxys calcitrans]
MPSAMRNPSTISKRFSSKLYQPSKINTALLSPSSSTKSISSQDSSFTHHENNSIYQRFDESKTESYNNKESEHNNEPIVLEPSIDILEKFISLPDLDDISDDEYVFSSNGEETEEDHVEISDDILLGEIPPPGALEPIIDIASKPGLKGFFADPLTGTRLPSIPSVSIKEPYDTALTSSQVDSGEISFEEILSAEINLELNLMPDIFEKEDNEDFDKYQEEDQTLNELLAMELFKELPLYDSSNAGELLVKEEEAKHLRQPIIELLDHLIHQAVEFTENISPRTFLRKRLVKRQLMLELFQKTKELEIKQNEQSFLNLKVVEYFRHKQVIRPILPDSKKNAQRDAQKYSEAIQRLEHMLAKENNVRALTQKRKQVLEDELRETAAKGQSAVCEFEDLIKMHLMSDSRPKFNALIERLLIRMSKCRQEINEGRYILLMKLHTEASLNKKLSKIEDLGNGVTMNSLNNLENETQILSKKIGEKNCDLFKLYTRFSTDVHMLNHFKEKQNMLRISVAAQRLALEKLKGQKQSLRRKMCQMKVKGMGIREQFNDLSFKAGLLDKPALMWDYDQTCVKVDELRNIITGLGKQIEKLKQRIEE